MDLGKRIPRRSLLKKSAVGLAVAGAAVAVPAVVFKATEDDDAQATMPDGSSQFDQPLVAYIHDASKGEVAIMYGTHEVVIQDPKLVARIIEATRNQV
jgi:hypothetical protein